MGATGGLVVAPPVTVPYGGATSAGSARLAATSKRPESSDHICMVLAIGLVLLAAPWLRERGFVARRLPAWTRALATVLIVYSISNFRGGGRAFIYLQF